MSFIMDCEDWSQDEGPPPPADYYGLKLTMTCGACPEQYDVTDGRGRRAGYLRLRHGNFYAAYPDYGGEIVYQQHTDGDGIFTSEEREGCLSRACKALKKAHKLATKQQ